jgi:hypothetical protein
MLISCIVLTHDNARPLVTAHKRALLEHFNWELFHHPSYSPDPAPSDYHLLEYLRNWLSSMPFSNNDEFMEGA